MDGIAYHPGTSAHERDTAITTDVVRIVLGVARLGENDPRGWWNGHALDGTGEYVLSNMFRRTWRSAALELDVAAAARMHNQLLGRSTALHLSRMDCHSEDGKLAGWRSRRRRLHDLRHTCASLAIAAGADVKVLQRMLGHASAALTLDRYGHLLPGQAPSVADGSMRWPRNDACESGHTPFRLPDRGNEFEPPASPGELNPTGCPA